MKIKLDSLKNPSETVCLHCGERAKREMADAFYQFKYVCGCKKMGSAGYIFGNIDYEYWIGKWESNFRGWNEDRWEITEGCGLHKNCGAKKGHLEITKVGDNYFIENKKYENNKRDNKAI